MRKFSVKVNGHVYDVEVTECTNGNSMGTVGMVSAPVTTSAPTAPVVPRTAPTVFFCSCTFFCCIRAINE